jgi:hypothetical protein
VNPFVFIVGCPRSGTTLLRRMVDARADLAIIPETQWVPKWFEERNGVTPEGFVTPEIIPSLLEYRRFSPLGIDRGQLERLVSLDGPVSYSSFVTRVFDLYGEVRGKRLVGEKSPGYVRRLRTLHHLWPKAKFVHLIRDGRDVALSAIGWRDKLARRFATSWSKDPVTAAALWWDWHVRKGREEGSVLAQELYHEIRYESLVSRPEEECAKLCDFLGIPYDGAMLRFHEGREQTDPGLSAKRAWLRVTPGLRDWRTKMPAEDVERFEAAAGDLLEELGYPRVSSRPRPEMLRHATAIRSLFAQDVRSRSQAHLLPEAWFR